MLAAVLVAGSSARSLKTPSAASTLSPAHPRATKTLARVASRVDRHRIIEPPAHSGRCHCPALGAAILVEPIRNLRISLAKPVGLNSDPRRSLFDLEI